MVDNRQEGRSQRSAPQRRHTEHLRRHAGCTPRKPRGWDGRGKKSQLAKHLVTWAAWTSDRHKTQAQPSLHLCGVPENLNLSSLGLESAGNPGTASDSSQKNNLEPEQWRLGKHTRCEWGQTQCGRDTVSTPHRNQCYLFAVFLPPRSTTEQVSLKKWPPLPPCIRAEIRHWTDQQTEEAKTEGTALEVTGAIY